MDLIVLGWVIKTKKALEVPDPEDFVVHQHYTVSIGNFYPLRWKSVK
jgi:hypothetical protein